MLPCKTTQDGITGTKLDDQTLAKQLENCDPVDTIFSTLQEHVRLFQECRGDEKIMKSLKCTVHVIHALSTSTTLGESIAQNRSSSICLLTRC
jgi:hypothetical protein